MHYTLCLQCPMKIFDGNLKVEELIDVERGNWKVEVIKNTLDAEEAELVCGIPFSLSRQKDRLIWRYTKNGQFNVKSAYHVDMSIRRREKGEASCCLVDSESWKAIWSMNNPGGVKTFIWKAINDCLPTRVNLTKRKIIEDPRCPFCEGEEESICHTLWSCAAASDA